MTTSTPPSAASTPAQSSSLVGVDRHAALAGVVHGVPQPAAAPQHVAGDVLDAHDGGAELGEVAPASAVASSPRSSTTTSSSSPIEPTLCEPSESPRSEPMVRWGRRDQRPLKLAARRSMNEVMPSWKSAVARTASLIAGIAATAAGSSSSSARRALAIVWTSASGRTCSDLGGDGQRPGDLLARLDDLLHEPDAVGLGGAELVGGQQVVHGVAPAGPLDVADRRPAERRQSALRLELAEAGVGRGDDDVAGERDLDADRERDALHRRDERLGEAAPQAERVDRLGTVGRGRGRRRGRRTAACRAPPSCGRRRT